MLNEPTMTKLYALKLNGMAEAYEEQRSQARMGDPRKAIAFEAYPKSGSGREFARRHF